MDSSLDLDKFFEKDIIEYLDTKSREAGGGTETPEDRYYKNLQQENFESANKELDKLVHQFNELPQNNVYKDITYKQINRAVEEGRKFLDNYTWDNELGVMIKKIDDAKELTDDTPSKINSYEERRAELEKINIEESNKLHGIKEKFDRKIKATHAQIFKAIRKSDLKTAIGYYRLLKKLFDQYPERFQGAKKQIYNDMLAYFFQIKKLQQELRKENYLKKNMEAEMRDKQGNKTLTIKDILFKIDTIKKHSRQFQFGLARNELVNLKKVVDNISEEHKGAKDILSGKVEIIQKNLDYAKKLHSEGDGK